MQTDAHTLVAVFHRFMKHLKAEMMDVPLSSPKQIHSIATPG